MVSYLTRFDRLLTALNFGKNNPLQYFVYWWIWEAFNTSDYAHAQLMQNSFLLE